MSDPNSSEHLPERLLAGSASAAGALEKRYRQRLCGRARRTAAAFSRHLATDRLGRDPSRVCPAGGRSAASTEWKAHRQVRALGVDRRGWYRPCLPSSAPAAAATCGRQGGMADIASPAELLWLEATRGCSHRGGLQGFRLRTYPSAICFRGASLRFSRGTTNISRAKSALLTCLRRQLRGRKILQNGLETPARGHHLRVRRIRNFAITCAVTAVAAVVEAAESVA